MSNEAIVDSLLEFYKSRGTDLSYLLEDSVFEKLPVQDKIAAIRRHAKTIYEGSPEAWNKEEKAVIKGSTISGVMSGAGLGILGSVAAWNVIKNNPGALANVMAKNKALAGTLLAGSIVGATAGAVTGYMRGVSSATPRLAMREQLGKVIGNPSDANTIGVLSIKPQYRREHALRDILLTKVTDKINTGVEDYSKKNLPELFKGHYSAYSSQPSLA